MTADNKSGLNCSTQENSQSVSATSSFFLFLPGLLDPTANQGPLPCCLRLHLLQLLLLFPLLGLECLGEKKNINIGRHVTCSSDLPYHLRRGRPLASLVPSVASFCLLHVQTWLLVDEVVLSAS